MTALKRQFDGVGLGQDVSKMLHEAGVIGLWRYDLSCDVVIGDESMAYSYGLDPEAVEKGLSPAFFRAAIHPEDLGSAVAALNEALKYRADYQTRYRLKDAEGQWRMVSVQGRLHFSSSGELSHIAGLNRLGEDDGDVDPVNRMALLAGELLKLSRAADDGEAHFMSQALLRHLGRCLAKRSMA